MKKIIVTSGQPFTDIDALSCAVAYVELLNSLDNNSNAVLPGPLNKSVTEKIKNWNLKFETSHKDNDEEYVLVDISDPDYFADFVNTEIIVEVFDHRTGFIEYRDKRLQNNSHIEIIGACATLIWEEF